MRKAFRIRLGWALAPKELVPQIAQFKYDGGTNPFMSRVATAYLRAHMHEHVDLCVTSPFLRARETADYNHYARAERLARRSLALRVGHNARARQCASGKHDVVLL